MTKEQGAITRAIEAIEWSTRALSNKFDDPTRLYELDEFKQARQALKALHKLKKRHTPLPTPEQQKSLSFEECMREVRNANGTNAKLLSDAVKG